MLPVLPQEPTPVASGVRPPVLDVLAAAARTSLAGGLYERLSEGAAPPAVEGYDPTEDLAGYEDYWRDLIRARSPAEMRVMKSRIDSELQGLQTIADAGGWGTAAAVTFGLADIPTLLSLMIPVAAPAAWGSRLERVATVVGVQMAADTASELALHKLQSQRTLGTSIINIGASALLTGLAGAWATRIPKDEFKRVADSIRSDLAEPPVKVRIEPEAPPAKAADAEAPKVAEDVAAPVHEPPSHVVTDITSRFHPLRAQAWKIKSALDKLVTVDRNDVRSVRKFVGNDKAESISAFVKRTGGIWDDGGEGAARDLTPKRAPGLIRAKRYGRDGADASMDAVRERVYDAGYFPNKNDYNEVTDEDIWDALAEEMMGRRLWNGDVEQMLRNVEMDERALNEFAQNGFTPDMTVDDIVKRLAETEMDDAVPMRDVDDDEFHTALTEYRNTEPPEFYVNPGEASTAGAAAAKTTTLEDETIAKGGVWMSRTMGAINPVLRVMNSPVVESRRLLQRLVTLTFKTNAHMRGVASLPSVEANYIRRYRSLRQFIAQVHDDGYRAYRARVKASGLDPGYKKPLSHSRFGEAMAHAGQQGDAHVIPEVEKAAKLIRSQVLDPLKADAQAVGALKSSGMPIGAPSYFPRVYNQAAIKAKQAELERLLYKHFWDGTQEPAEVMADVRAAIDQIQGVRIGSADIEAGPGVAGNLKKRLLDVPDVELRPWLIVDYDSVLNGYLRSVLPQIEMHRAFGSIDLKAEFAEITDAYERKILAAKTSEAKQALVDRRELDRKLLAGMRDRTLNQVGPRANESAHLVRAGRLLRGYNYKRFLGRQTLSSISDVHRLVARFGLRRTAVATAKWLASSDLRKIAKADAQRAGAAVAHVLDSRGATLGEIGDELPGSRIERLDNWASHKFTQLTLMASWNNSIQSIGSLLLQDDIARVAAGEARSAYRMAHLSQFGIDPAMLKRIGAQFDQFGEVTDGLRRARTDLWVDREAAKALEDAVVSLGDQLVVVKGVGDLPLFMDKEIYKAMLQFKSFGMASVSRNLVSMGQGIAHGDLATINGAALALGLGSLSYYLREKAAGNEPDLRPSRVIAESLNWSGLLAYMPDIYDTVGNGIFQIPFRFARYQDRSPVETALGPTFGTATDLFAAASRAGDVLPWADGKGLREADIHMMRKLIPFQNVFWLHRVVSGLEGELADATGAEGADYKSFTERVLETKPAPTH
jgi:hypothetical protein